MTCCASKSPMTLILVAGLLAALSTASFSQTQETPEKNYKADGRGTFQRCTILPTDTRIHLLGGMLAHADGTPMISFHQITGPLSGRPMASKEIRNRLNWPRPGMSPGYDMTGTIQEIIHLASHDGGKTWTKVSSEPFHTP